MKEKISKVSKIATYAILFIIILLVVLASYFKISKNHKTKLYDSMASKIEESALKCYREDICKEKKIFLKELYDNEYLDEVINPKNNEYLDEESFVEITDEDTAKLTIVD